MRNPIFLWIWAGKLALFYGMQRSLAGVCSFRKRNFTLNRPERFFSVGAETPLQHQAVFSYVPIGKEEVVLKQVQ